MHRVRKKVISVYFNEADGRNMDAIEENIRQYFCNQREVVGVYLFGSHATGKNRPFSDVDVGVVFHHHAIQEAVGLQSRFTVELGRRLRKDVHVTVLNTAGELLLKQVFQKGTCVCINDLQQLRRFEMSSYAMIADFGYYLTMTQNGFQRALGLRANIHE
jgi:predicted nucleotidyltransferase